VHRLFSVHMPFTQLAATKSCQRQITSRWHQSRQYCVNAAYHHFGMISPFKVARDLARNSSNGSKKFFDEFMTWRELSYAFCFQHWPDLESVQVSLQCPHPLLLALLICASSTCLANMFALVRLQLLTIVQMPGCLHL